MFGIRFRKRDPEKDRYYLLPGMGRGARRKHQTIIKISIAVGIIVGCLLGLMIYFINQ